MSGQDAAHILDQMERKETAEGDDEDEEDMAEEKERLSGS